MSTLIQREELFASLGSHVVLAVSPVGHGSNADAAEAFLAGHVPAARLAYGAIFTRTPEAGEGRGPLPRHEVLEESLRSLGLELDDDIVLYDSSKNVYAARAWWVLRNAGFGQVRILDGGLPYWQAGGLPVEAGPVAAVRSELRIGRTDRLINYDGDQVAGHPAGGLLVDARDARRFGGEQHPTLDPRGGHIPGAVNLPWLDNLDADGRFLPAATLREKLEAIGVSDDRLTVHYCGSGVSGAFNIVAQTIAGYTNVGLYPGSWSEWAADPSRPIEVAHA